MRTEVSRLNQISVTEREEPLATKYHVIEYPDTKHLTSFLESARDFLVFLTRRSSGGCEQKSQQPHKDVAPLATLRGDGLARRLGFRLRLP
jgi:hypothetical protein